MDGPSIGSPGGGGFIASAFVEVGADLSGLRAAEEEAKQIVARIGAMGGGGSIGNPVNGATSGGMMMIQLKVDEQGIRSQLDSFFRSYQPPTIKVQVETEGGGGGYTVGGTTLGGSVSRGLGTQGNQILSAMQRNLADAQSAGDVAGVARFQGIIDSFGGGGAAVSSGRYRDYYPAPGLRFSGRGRQSPFYAEHAPRLSDLEDVGGPSAEEEDEQGQIRGGSHHHIGFRRAMMIGYLADRAFRSIGGFVGAEDIAANPARIGAGYALSADSATTAPFAAMMAQAQAAQARYSAIENFPIIGGLIGLTGMQSGLNFDAMRAQQAMSAAIGLHSEAEAASVGILAVGGNTVAAAQRRASLAEQAAARKMFAARNRATGYTPDEVIEDYNAVVDQGREDVAAARRADVAVFTRANADAASAIFGRDAATTLASFSPGSRMEAMRLRQAAHRESLRGQLQAAVDASDPFHRGLAQMGMRARMGENEAQNNLETIFEQRNTGIQVGNIEAQGIAATLLARHNPFAAQLTIFDRQAAVAREQAQGLSQPEQDRIDRSLIAQRSAMVTTHNEQVTNAFGNAGVGFGNSLLSVQAAALRMQNRGAEADLLGFQAQQSQLAEAMRQQFAQLNFGNIGTVLPNLIGLAGQGVALGANQAAAQFAFQHSLAMESYSIGARGNIADALIGDQPRNARAIGSVARARLELENAPANLRGQLRATLQRELEAEEHQLVGQIGGHAAIGMGVSSAIGYVGGHDLRGVGYDRIAASRTLEQGVDALGTGIGPQQASAISAGVSKLVQLLPSLISAIQAATSQTPN